MSKQSRHEVVVVGVDVVVVVVFGKLLIFVGQIRFNQRTSQGRFVLIIIIFFY